LRGSIKLGRILGIPLRVHWTFLVLLALIGLYPLYQGRPLEALWSVVTIIVLFACVIGHELAHSMVARMYGVQVESITLLPIGGVAAMREMPRKPSEEALMAIAGPVASLGLAGLFAIIIAAVGSTGPTGFMGQPILLTLMITNMVLAVFNLLPAFPLDGGRVLRAVLAHYMGAARATRIAVTIGQAMAILLGIFGLLRNPWLMFIAVFIFFGAGQEGRQAQAQAVLEQITARQAMVVRYETLHAHWTLAEALQYASQGYQQEFPVIYGDAIVGVVTRGALYNAAHSLGPHHYVQEVMTQAVCQVTPETDMAEIYKSMAQGTCGIVLVREADRVVGIVTVGGVQDQLMGAADSPPRPH